MVSREISPFFVIIHIRPSHSSLAPSPLNANLLLPLNHSPFQTNNHGTNPKLMNPNVANAHYVPSFSNIGILACANPALTAFAGKLHAANALPANSPYASVTYCHIPVYTATCA